jgi:hypothetical protein
MNNKNSLYVRWGSQKQDLARFDAQKADQVTEPIEAERNYHK